MNSSKSTCFPLAVVGEGGWALGNWAQGYQKYWHNKKVKAEDSDDRDQSGRHEENASAFGRCLKSIMDEYQIVFIELDEHLELDKVCDIFTRINSRGIRLDVFDLINALLRPKGIKLQAAMARCQG